MLWQVCHHQIKDCRVSNHHGGCPYPSDEDNVRPVAVIDGNTGEIHAERPVAVRCNAVFVMVISQESNISFLQRNWKRLHCGLRPIAESVRIPTTN